MKDGRRKIREHLAHLARLGYATVRERAKVLQRFARVRFRVERFLAELPESVHSRLNNLCTLRTFLRFAGRGEEAERISLPRRPKKPPLRPPTREDVRALLLSRHG